MIRISKFGYYFYLITIIISLNLNAQECSFDRALIKEGDFIPLYSDSGQSIHVDAFVMDKTAVTNKQFLEFVKNNPEWRKGNVKEIFAEHSYLSHWEADTILGEQAPPNSPVVYISWFAAKSYCTWCNGQLPYTDQWEYTASADPNKANAYQDENFKSYLLQIYNKNQTTPLPPVRSTFENYWGLWDMHGLIWEWVLDFNSVLISGESRKDNSLDRGIFCAAGSIGSIDPANYTAFLRYSLRGSLKANYCIKNLGFRCSNTK